MQRAVPLVWRLTVLWQGTVVDVVAVDRRARIVLRSGDVVLVNDEAAVLRLQTGRFDSRVGPGDRLPLDGGHVLVVERDRRGPVAPLDVSIDSTFLHAALIGVATVLCLLSALWLAPLHDVDEGGAGVPTEARRWLTLPGGTARTVARPVWSASGRRPVAGERVMLTFRHGVALPRRAGPGPSLDQTLAAMKEALRGSAGDERRDPLGDLRRTIAAAPVLGAGVGGLSPRDPLIAGPGTSVIAIGDSPQLTRVLPTRDTQLDARLPLPTKRVPTYPVQLVDVPPAAVDAQDMEAGIELDPLVREQLLGAVHQRTNVVRSCYESWGIAENALRRGRLVIEFTLRPDGHLDDVTTTDSGGLQRVGDCVRRAAVEWYLGDGLVEQPTRLSFPFWLRPRT